MGKRANRVPLSCAALLLLLLCAPAGAGAAAGPEGEAVAPPQASALLLELRAAKAQVYRREPVSVTVTLFTGQAQVRDLEYPRLAGSSFTLGEFAPPLQRTVVRDGQDLLAYEFSAVLIPLKSGPLSLGPAELGCDTLSPADGPAAFFGGTQARRVTLRSAAAVLKVLPLPQAGRPAGFSGAVGRFTLTRSARPTELRAGDPVTVRTVIRGAGNIEAFSCNALSVPGWRSYPPRTALRGSTLTCEQVVVPDSPAARVIPAVEASFFDPDTGHYRSCSSGPLPLRVSAAAAPAPDPVPRTGSARQAPAPSPAAAAPSLPLFACLLLAAGLAGYPLARGLRGGKPGPEPSGSGPAEDALRHLARAEEALAGGALEEFYTSVSRALQAASGTSGGLTPVGSAAPPGRDGCCAAAWSAPGLQGRCDAVRYGKHRPGRAEMSADLKLLRELLAIPSP